MVVMTNDCDGCDGGLRFSVWACYQTAWALSTTTSYRISSSDLEDVVEDDLEMLLRFSYSIKVLQGATALSGIQG